MVLFQKQKEKVLVTGKMSSFLADLRSKWKGIWKEKKILINEDEHYVDQNHGCYQDKGLDSLFDAPSKNGSVLTLEAEAGVEEEKAKVRDRKKGEPLRKVSPISFELESNSQNLEMYAEKDPNESLIDKRFGQAKVLGHTSNAMSLESGLDSEFQSSNISIKVEECELTHYEVPKKYRVSSLLSNHYTDHYSKVDKFDRLESDLCFLPRELLE